MIYIFSKAYYNIYDYVVCNNIYDYVVCNNICDYVVFIVLNKDLQKNIFTFIT